MTVPLVLIVDDDEDVVDLMRVKFRAAGIPADVAESADEALELMRKHLYAVVITDIHMPGTNGVQLVSNLKEISPLVQILMRTADASMSRVIECMDRGAVDFFSKEDDFSLMIESVRTALTRAGRWKKWIGGHEAKAPASMST